MSIRSFIKSVRVGLKTGVKATDALLKMTDHIERDTKRLLDIASEVKEKTPDDEEESEAK